MLDSSDPLFIHDGAIGALLDLPGPNLALAVQSPCMQQTHSHSWTIHPVFVKLPDAHQVAVDLRLHNKFRVSHRIP
jgi:hypothetical protein